MIQSGLEIQTFLFLCRNMHVRSYVELGTENGDSIALARRTLPPETTVITVDRANEEREHNGIQYVRGNTSHEPVFATAMGHCGGAADAVFIDADHAEAACRSDWALWGSKARMIVGFHDVRQPGVHVVFEEARIRRLGFMLEDREDQCPDYKGNYGIGVVIMSEGRGELS